jgi:predicted ribosome quality control (RQC) complex YloA/Tae2 family protein
VITNYYVLSALASEWEDLFAGAQFVEAYSHLPSELTLVFELQGGTRRAIRASAVAGRAFIYSQEDPRRPRTNVTPLFEPAVGQTVSCVSVTPGDRILRLDLGEQVRFEIHPYGSKPNVLLVSGEIITEAFKHSEDLQGTSAPVPRTVAMPANRQDLDDRMARMEGSPDSLVRKVLPSLGSYLAREVVSRSPDDIWTGLEAVLHDLRSPHPVAYVVDEELLFSPILLLSLETEPSDRFESVDEGVRWTVKQRSRSSRLERLRRPIESALERSVGRWTRRVQELEKAIETESRADTYETWGHLLMASPPAATAGMTKVVLENLLGEGEPVTIPLDPNRSWIENAERHYERAKNLRGERSHLEQRLSEARSTLAEVSGLFEDMRRLTSVKEVEQFRKSRASSLQRHVGGKTESVRSSPFRRFKVTGGQEVWVGRNASENDRLTFQHAASHDFWMHARGVPGSHVILKMTGRKDEAGSRAKEEAAGIAAWFSTARGSSLVPVQVARKKHVTKPRGAGPGVVRVQREEVLLVEPKLPEG